MRKTELTLMVLALSGLAAVMAAGPAFAQHGAGNKVFVKLPRPQGDDQGHYVPVMQDGIAAVIGFASPRGGVARVTVNGVFASARGGVASVTVNGVVPVNGVVDKLRGWCREHVSKGPTRGLGGVYWPHGAYDLGIVGGRHSLGFGWRSSW